MKNLNKKIGAMALSGMMILGVAAMSGVNAHASSLENRYPGIEIGRQVLSNEEESKIKQVEGIASQLSEEGRNVILLDVAKHKDKMKRMLKDYHGFKNLDVILSRIQNANSEGMLRVLLKGNEKGYFIFNYDGFYYLFLISK